MVYKFAWLLLKILLFYILIYPKQKTQRWKLEHIFQKRDTYFNKCKIAKGPWRLKTRQKWRSKKAKSMSISKSKSGDLRQNSTRTIHYYHEALGLVLIIKRMGLQMVALLTLWYYIINQKTIEKSQHIKLVKWSNVIG